uniref:RNF111_N domain-containing protein n=1 Tax=Parastrongyloides trichosuri TaxID=131310 RepID=A0A0N4ZBE8_PARTI
MTDSRGNYTSSFQQSEEAQPSRDENDGLENLVVHTRDELHCINGEMVNVIEILDSEAEGSVSAVVEVLSSSENRLSTSLDEGYSLPSLNENVYSHTTIEAYDLKEDGCEISSNEIQEIPYIILSSNTSVSSSEHSDVEPNAETSIPQMNLSNTGERNHSHESRREEEQENTVGPANFNRARKTVHTEAISRAAMGYPYSVNRRHTDSNDSGNASAPSSEHPDVEPNAETSIPQMNLSNTSERNHSHESRREEEQENTVGPANSNRARKTVHTEAISRAAMGYPYSVNRRHTDSNDSGNASAPSSEHPDVEPNAETSIPQMNLSNTSESNHSHESRREEEQENMVGPANFNRARMTVHAATMRRTAMGYPYSVKRRHTDRDSDSSSKSSSSS